MARTQVRGNQLRDHDVTVDDIDISTPGKAVITKIKTGPNIKMISTGVDDGTGEVELRLDPGKIDGGIF